MAVVVSASLTAALSHPVPAGVFGAAGVVLHQPELASSRIVELGQVPWPEVVEAVLAVPLD